MSKKDAYIAKAQAKIEEQIAKLNTLKAQAKGGVAHQKIELHSQIEKIESKLEAAKSRLTEIVDSSEDRWEDLSARFESLSDEVAISVKKFFGK